MNEPSYEAVWPLGKSAYSIEALAHRLSDLNGKTICELWDYLFRGDEIYPIIREVLKKRYTGIKFIDYPTFGNTHGKNEKEVIAALPDLLRKHKCDAVLSATGA